MFKSSALIKHSDFMKVFVTGGAGFIGSHIVDKLLERGDFVTVYDNLSTGNKEFIEHNFKNKNFKFIEGDLLDLNKLEKSIKGHDFVFHIAANADVRGGIINTKVDLEQNIIATHNILDTMRKDGIRKIVFASSSVVYGEPTRFPTPEDYGPLAPISLYGSSKLACEGLITAFCHTFDMQSWIFRFGNVTGERYTHGVIFDFVKKLLQNSKELEILGDGKQKKTYIYVIDLINAMFLALEKANETFNIFNLGNDGWIEVTKVADIICKEMGLDNVKYRFTGGARGWKGDAPFVFLDITKIKKLGWKPKISLEDSIRITTQYLLKNKYLLSKRK